MIPKRLTDVHGRSGLNLILGVSRETIERDVLQPMREMYTDRLVGTINGRNIARVCGEDVYCLGAEKITQVAKIQGMSVKYCYGDEVAKWNPEVFHMLQSRLDKPYSCFDGSCNPESPNHWLKEFLDNPEIDIYNQHYTIFDNPFLPAEFVENLCKEYEGTVYYDRYILGKWALAEGLIFPMYESALGDVEDGSKASEYCLSIDYGTMNAFAALLWEKHGNVWYATRGYYYSGRDTGIQKTDEEYGQALDDLIRDVMEERESEGKRTLLSGSSTFRKMETIIDPSAASFITLLRKKRWYNVRPADNAVLDGIRETASAMQRGLIKVSPSIKEWIDEAQGYVWDDSADEDRPVKIADHCVTGDTVVRTEDGEVLIAELVGTEGRVYSYNLESKKIELKSYSECRITQRQAKIYRIELEDGKFIRCTAEHPILTERGYVRVSDLREDDRIIEATDSVKSIGIKSIIEDGIEDVYNMEVEGNHNYLVNGGIVVHNCMDATRYFVKTKRIAVHKTQYKSIFS